MTSRRFASPFGSAAAQSAPVSAGAYVAESIPEFPGCRPIRITRDAIADHESRIEYWCMEIILAILRNRGLAVSERLAVRIAGADPNVLAAAALACRDEADLLVRLEQRRRANRRTRTRDR